MTLRHRSRIDKKSIGAKMIYFSSTAIAAAANIDGDIRNYLFAFFANCAAKKGFEFVEFGSLANVPRLRKWYSSLPASWLEVYERQGFNLADPVAEFAAVRRAMFSWTEIESLPSLSLTQRNMLDTARANGLVSTISTPIFGIAGTSMLVTFSSSAKIPYSLEIRRSLQRLARSIHVMHTTFCEAAAETSAEIQLSHRQSECLEWIASGKSSWAISRILGVTPDTVNYHIKTAMAKLGTSSRFVAVLRAIQCGALTIGE